MGHSLFDVVVHLVFSTKRRQAFLHDPKIRDEMHAYMWGLLRNLGCKPIIINSVEDHGHLLLALAKGMAGSRVVEELKRSSSKWLKTKAPDLELFRWQTGYGMFSVKAGEWQDVFDYIANQEEHHKTTSFQDEVRSIYRSLGIEPDERYVWD